MSRVLIIGGAGYVGSVLTRYLLDRDYAVTVLDNFSHGENSLAHLVDFPQFAIAAGDCRDERILAPLLKAHDAVIPLAALVGAPACERNPADAWRLNSFAIELLCSLAGRDQLILFPMTNSGYGIGGAGECTEASPLHPLSVYGQTKAHAEDVVMQRKNSVSLRLATAFGPSPRMRLDLLVNDFVWRAVTDRAVVLFEPHFRRNFIHVYDIAAAFEHMLEGPERGIFNVGDSRANMTKLELCQTIARHVPGFAWFEGKGGDPDKRDYIVSNAKIEATGWAPSVSLDEGIAELLKLYVCLKPNRYANV